MRRLLPIVLLLAACPPPYIGPRPPPPTCPGSCFLGMSGSDDCEGFGQAEARIRATFPAPGCERLQHYRVRVYHPDGGSWVDPYGRKVAGLTHCGGGVIEIGTDVWTQSALAHEAVHALECPAPNYDHLGWADAGWNSTIDRANQQPAPFLVR